MLQGNKIAFIVTSLSARGGAEGVIFNLLKRFREITVITIYSSKTLPLFIEKNPGIKIIPLHKSFPLKIFRPFYFIGSFFKLKKIIKEKKFRLLVSFLYEPAILSRFAGYFRGKKICVINSVRAARQSMNNFTEYIYLLIEKLTCKFGEKYVFVSNSAKTYLVSKVNIPEERILPVIENGIDIKNNFFYREKKSAYVANLLGLSESCIIVGAVGRLCAHKGYEYFIASAKNICLSRDDIKFVIFGNGELRNRLKKMIIKSGLEEKFFLAGEEENIEKVYSGLDIYVSSSLSEGMSNTLLEAMALGVPIVATDIPANRELLSDGISGILVNKKDPVALGRGIIKFFENPDLSEKCRKEARKYIEQKFTLEIAIKKWRETLETEVAGIS